MVNYGKLIQAPYCSLTNWKAHCFLSPEWSALIVRWRWLQAMLDKLIFTERHHKETFWLRIPQRSVVIIKHIILYVALVKFLFEEITVLNSRTGKVWYPGVHRYARRQEVDSQTEWKNLVFGRIVDRRCFPNYFYSTKHFLFLQWSRLSSKGKCSFLRFVSGVRVSRKGRSGF